eukprot:Rhum_TRINITY_DN15473_c3_g2::Rhum_TRINITY_DN15473_c3_g2_i4::g.158362::m.158362
MNINCRDDLRGDTEVLELRGDETASQLLTRVCELFGREEEDTALEMDGEVVWVSGWDAADVAVSSLSLHDVVLRRSLERVLLLAQHQSRPDLPAWAWKERSVVLEAVKADAGKRSLLLAHQDLLDDREFMFAALAIRASVLELASPRLRDDREFALAACIANNVGLLNVSSRLRDDEDFVREVVKHHPESLFFASERLRQMLGVRRASPLS